ncbi:methyltransferase domain-containing protein [Endothiovibrio diazotrophicus]
MSSPALSLPAEPRSRALNVSFALEWASERMRHTEERVIPKYNTWRDLPPTGLEALLAEGVAGDGESCRYRPGELAPIRHPRLTVEVPAARFNRGPGRIPLEPQVGRFYPRGMIAGVRGIFSSEYQPMRLIEADGGRLRFDLNHPLAGRELTLRATIHEARDLPHEHGGACNDVAALMTGYGPGMQARHDDRPTHFLDDSALRRGDGGDDARFYAAPRLVSHLDATARARLAARMEGLIPAGSRVLDLMSSIDSHLPDGLTAAVTGLGMNEEELAANPRLARRVVHDLNAEPRLPFPDGSFDVLTCHLSVEYLIRPLAVFEEAARVLRPGGRVVVSFSNRWFPPKAIHLWTQLHEFERMGLVAEYLLAGGRFEALESWSLRGLPRPLDDRHIRRSLDADPLYLVSGVRHRENHSFGDI